MRGLIYSQPLAWGLLVFVLAGCSGDGTYNVSGKVTFKNAPVPAGKIYFIPDGEKGNTGPTGYADIKDGSYNTSWSGGKGAVGGPTVVAIEGFDPSSPAKVAKGDTSGEQTVKALFPQYEFKVELPRSSTTKDFDVPAEAAKRRDTGENPGVIVP
jgi:hypothetical protein